MRDTRDRKPDSWVNAARAIWIATQDMVLPVNSHTWEGLERQEVKASGFTIKSEDLRCILVAFLMC